MTKKKIPGKQAEELKPIDFKAEIDQYLNQTRLRDRIMKEMIKKLEKTDTPDKSKPKKKKNT